MAVGAVYSYPTELNEVLTVLQELKLSYDFQDMSLKVQLLEGSTGWTSFLNVDLSHRLSEPLLSDVLETYSAYQMNAISSLVYCSLAIAAH